MFYLKRRVGVIQGPVILMPFDARAHGEEVLERGLAKTGFDLRQVVVLQKRNQRSLDSVEFSSLHGHSQNCRRDRLGN